MKRNIVKALVLVALGAGGAYAYILLWRAPGDGAAEPAAEFCTEHQIAEADCPWCDPSLVESKGQCPEHGVPEALCAKCNPALIPGFKAEVDWCAGHGVPESQCALCQAGLLPPGESG